MSKVLVSYFSASGVTKRVAEKVSTAINGDLFEIKPVEKYTNEDLDWTNKVDHLLKLDSIVIKIVIVSNKLPK